MSHIVTIATRVTDTAAVRAACQRLRLAEPVQGKARLFSGEVEGLAVKLPGWHYPVVADVTSGILKYDNFQGRWGADAELNKFLQAYAVEKCRIEARTKGNSCTEQTLPDGSIKLTIQLNGGAA